MRSDRRFLIRLHYLDECNETKHYKAPDDKENTCKQLDELLNFCKELAVPVNANSREF